MTDQQFNDWLADEAAIRLMLVEVEVTSNGIDLTRYLSSGSYTTGSVDTPANTSYLPVVMGGVKYTVSISATGSAGLSAGDIELQNAEGDLDGWLYDVWKNRSLRVYIGDPRWPRADFRLMFDGVVDDVDSKNRTRLNIKIRDKLQRLNTPATENKLGGTSQNKDRVLPLLFGECHNITPLLIDEATHQYQIHDGPIESIIEVRDNGLPTSYQADLATGTFKLTVAPAGTITVSAQGAKVGGTYTNTVAGIIKLLATDYGKASSRFTLAEIDTANFDAFDAGHPQPVGVYLGDRTNVLQVCQSLAASLGAQPIMSFSGKLQLVQLLLPAPGDPITIGPEDMYQQQITPSAKSEVVSAVKVGYAKNWTVQADLQTGLPESHKAMFAEEWLTYTATDDAVASTYRLDVEPAQRDTYLLRLTDAQAEADRDLALRREPRISYRFEAVASKMTATIGQAVTLTHPRFGLDGGKSGVITSIQPDWMRSRVVLEVMA